MYRTKLLTLSLLGFIASGLGISAARAETGDCEVTSGSEGGFRYVVLKCALRSEPGNYKIRSTIWERELPANFQQVIRFSGQKFSCDLTEGGATYTVDVINTPYKLSNCRGSAQERRGLLR